MAELSSAQRNSVRPSGERPVRPGAVARTRCTSAWPKPVTYLVGLHQTLGNRTVQRMLRSRMLQAKLTINEPGDQYEREADRVAESVMEGSGPQTRQENAFSTPTSFAPARTQLQRTCACGGTPAPDGECSACRAKRLALQRRATGSVAPVTTPPVVHEVLGSPGQPLDPVTRASMELRFGHDFSGVRVHTDARANESALAIRAQAYTMGRHVVFGAGQYAPETVEGKRLLAHELTHTVQQLGADGVTGDKPTHLQRTIGDGHDLTAARFVGDPVLEAVYDDERMLRAGDRGPAVVKLQRALMDAGFPLPKFGADGIFGAETMAAVQGFQRASGLTGASVDGIAGPITMGWLDQRFSAGPTPAGAAPGSTPGCAAVKTVTVDAVSLRGSPRNPTDELERANTIFNQCCVRFALGTGASASSAQSDAWLGVGDNQLDDAPGCGSASAEEIALFSGATADFGLSSSIRVFFVASVSSGNPAYSVPPFCATGAAAGVQNMAVVTNTASVRGLAHEFGHVLLDSGDHPADPINLMSAPAAPPGEQLTPAQCGTVFANA
jgi:peptidoglycan hydrolase-like protein with peptidoglycan-binding domain